jgi:NADPH:quinone reductase-like Zn-dependent oxidoreductase
MKAFVVGRYGSTDGVQMQEMPEPDVGEHDVLVQVRAASVNLLDAKIRDGEFKLILPYRVPFVLGNDLAGLVVRAGPAVRSFAPGDEVYARPGTDHIGTFAELAAVHEDDLALKPATLTMEESAALPLVALTAWQALVERADLQPGQKVLIHAGSGGVGTIAIQLARHLGAHVATTTGTANTGWVKNLGADVVIDYRRDDFEKVLRDYDVVLDSLGGQTLEKSLRVLKPGGIVIGIAGPPDPGFAREIGANPVVRLATVLLSARTRLRARRRHVRYSFLFMKASGEQLRAIAALADTGTIRPVIDRVVPFDSAKDAIAYVESGRAKGKVVVTMADLPPARPVRPPIAQTQTTLTHIPSTERHGRE